MPLRIRVEGYGETIVDRELVKFHDRLDSPMEALKLVAKMLREIVEQQFASEGAHASGGWPPLAASTIQQKAALGLDPHILVATGDLRESLTNKHSPNAIERLLGDTLVFGSKVEYGIYHQSSRPRKRLPYRPPIALTQQDKAEIVRELQKTLAHGGSE
jgi:phage gpG-like protein